jgi:hypothetical protein
MEDKQGEVSIQDISRKYLRCDSGVGIRSIHLWSKKRIPHMLGTKKTTFCIKCGLSASYIEMMVLKNETFASLKPKLNFLDDIDPHFWISLLRRDF